MTEDSAAGEYRALTQCVLISTKSGKLLTPSEQAGSPDIFNGCGKAGLRLTMAELVSLEEHGVKPVPELWGRKTARL